MEVGLVARPDGNTYRNFAYPGSVCLLSDGSLFTVFTAKKSNGLDEAVGVYSVDDGNSWSQPETLFGGMTLSNASSDLAESYSDPSLVVLDEKRVIVFCVSTILSNGQENLSRSRFWRRISENGGRNFGTVEEMPRHKQYYVGMVHPGLRLQNGSLVMGYSWDVPAESGVPAHGEGERLKSTDAILCVYNDHPQLRARLSAVISTDGCRSWSAPKVLAPIGHEETPEASYPALCELPNGTIVTVFGQVNRADSNEPFTIRYARFNPTGLKEFHENII